MSVRKSSNPLVATGAGAIAGGVETLAVWPMEFVKTQLQLQQKVAQPVSSERELRRASETASELYI